MSDAFAVSSRRTFSSEQEFAAFAAEIARGLRPGDVVALGGGLGAGKTTFVRAAVRALHGADEGSSPTFTFRHRYEGRPPIEHLDLFRVEHERELTELGLEDAFDGDAIAFVEWWERGPSLLPERRLEIEIDGAGEAPRTVTVTRRKPA
jgi:tRNA threonylcarbamoyl adenosine modification protein YjeE